MSDTKKHNFMRRLFHFLYRTRDNKNNNKKKTKKNQHLSCKLLWSDYLLQTLILLIKCSEKLFALFARYGNSRMTKSAKIKSSHYL